MGSVDEECNRALTDGRPVVLLVPKVLVTQTGPLVPGVVDVSYASVSLDVDVQV